MHSKGVNMNNNTILNWDDADHKAIYIKQIAENPIWWNEDLNIWVTYSYQHCKAVLMSNDAHVPEPIIKEDSLLNNMAKLMIRKLARITNNMQHQESRQAAMMIYQYIKPVAIDRIVDGLLSKTNPVEFDFVATIAKQLPVLVILRGMGFNEEECTFVVENISTLVQIMSPNKTDYDIIAINSVVNEFYAIAERFVKAGFSDHSNDSIELFVVNLLGLFIQSYDTGRGLLCNTLINMVAHHNEASAHFGDQSYLKRLVIETLRLDPPVHNTRRIAIKDLMIGNQLIKAGEPVMIVLAAANLDPGMFKDPEKYDPFRSNNEQHLTFGIGGHNCLAKYLTIDMATDACSYLANKYPYISIIQKEFKYEAALNARMVKELRVKFT